MPDFFAHACSCQVATGGLGLWRTRSSDGSRGPMDRTMASEAVGAGSIPAGITSRKPLKINDL